MAARSKAARVRSARKAALARHATTRAVREAKSDPMDAYLQRLTDQRDHLDLQRKQLEQYRKQLEQYITTTKAALNTLRGLKFFGPAPSSAPQSLPAGVKLSPPHVLGTRKSFKLRTHLIPGIKCKLCGGPVHAKRASAQFCIPRHNWIYNSALKRGQLPEAMQRYRYTGPEVGVGGYDLKCEYMNHPFKGRVKFQRFCTERHKTMFYREQRKKGLDPVRYKNRSEGIKKARAAKAGNGADNHEPASPHKAKPVVLVHGDNLSS